MNRCKELWREFKAFMDYTYTAEYAHMSNKVNYVIGHFVLFITVYLLGASPGKYFFYWISFLTVALVAKRSILFKNLGYQFYMIDYCYVTNLFTMLFVF